jgi:hypothetical protein
MSTIVGSEMDKMKIAWGLIASGAALSLLGGTVAGDFGLLLALGGFTIWLAGVGLQIVGVRT